LTFLLAASEMFIIPLDDECEKKDLNSTRTDFNITFNSTERKFPKRLQKIIDEASHSENSINKDNLQKKLQEAELRRQEYLKDKIQNIQKFTYNNASTLQDSS